MPIKVQITNPKEKFKSQIQKKKLKSQIKKNKFKSQIQKKCKMFENK